MAHAAGRCGSPHAVIFICLCVFMTLVYKALLNEKVYVWLRVSYYTELLRKSKLDPSNPLDREVVMSLIVG